MLPSDFHETLKIVWRPNVRGLGNEEYCGARVGSCVASAQALHAQSICSISICCQNVHLSRHGRDAHSGRIGYIHFCIHHFQLLTSPHRIFRTIWQKELSTTISGAASCCRQRIQKRYRGSLRRAASPPGCLLALVHIVGFWRCPAMYILHSSNRA